MINTIRESEETTDFYRKEKNCESFERSKVMRRFNAIMMVMVFMFTGVVSVTQAAQKFRRIPVKEYVDKMKAGWIGQIIGVSWGAPTEGRYRQIMPEKDMPPFRDSLINDAFGQDDIYVEMTFLRTLELYGMDVSIRQAGIDFANSRYPLWVANNAGRNNLRNGIAPPDSSHPKFHSCAGAIDYQIEADYSGLIAPGMPNVVIALGEKFGRLMNYGDGMYAGQFMGGMYAEAFFEKDVLKVIEAGLRCIPVECLYAEMVRDMLRWRRENPNWEKTWELVDKKYRSPDYYISQLDVKLEGAFVLMGLLYGDGDLDKTMVISCRCGSDSDCNPSSSGGVLFTTLGVSKLPDRYYKQLNEKAVFSHTAYTFPALIDVCEKLARQSVVKAGGRIEKDANGEEVFAIPIESPKPSRFEDLRKPGPIADSSFTKKEMAKITVMAGKDLSEAISKFAPGWKLAKCGEDMNPGLLAEWAGKKSVLMTHPLDRNTGCVLSKKVKIPGNKKTTLHLVVGHHPEGDWTLLVKADGKELLSTSVGKETAENGWMQTDVDLSDYAGKEINLELVNQPSGWQWEAGYWAKIELMSE
ncbi:MAG: ADP-ribosylglycohydrolase family protein [Phycisphaerae bacterium]|nr:ADP-ribosylglycohydrolase family protein [Phycisphaerae bacterium]